MRVSKRSAPARRMDARRLETSAYDEDSAHDSLAREGTPSLLYRAFNIRSSV